MNLDKFIEKVTPKEINKVSSIVDNITPKEIKRTETAKKKITCYIAGLEKIKNKIDIIPAKKAF